MAEISLVKLPSYYWTFWWYVNIDSCNSLVPLATSHYLSQCRPKLCRHMALPGLHEISRLQQHLGSEWLSKSFPAVVESFNTLRPRQNGRHFADDIFKCIFMNENVWIRIKISMKFVPKGPIYNIPALVQILAWRRPGDKPLSEPLMVSLTTHICVTRPQWVKQCYAAWSTSKN